MSTPIMFFFTGPLPKLKELITYIYQSRECEREREREGWPPPFLLLFLTGMGNWPTPLFLFSIKGWGDAPLPSLRREIWPPPFLFVLHKE
jgi:hypothetical protein